MTEKKKTNPLEIWEQSDKPPKTALKQIKGGRISGMTDINPQWRFHKLTELFGAVGVGWWTEETRREFVPCGDEIAVFVDINLYIKGFDHPVQGSGGNVFRVSESRGLRLNDECIKMATTDAVSVCCKQLGIGSAIYEGRWDGSKYREDAPDPQPQKKATPKERFLKVCAEHEKILGKDKYEIILSAYKVKVASDVETTSVMGDIVADLKKNAKESK